MINKIIKFSIPNIINMFLGLLSAFVLTRIFAPEKYGILNIFHSTVATTLSILYLGLDSGFIRFYNEPPKDNGNKQLGTKLLMLCLGTTVIIGIICTIFFSEYFTRTIFGFASTFLCAMVFTSVLGQAVLRFLNIKYRMDFNTRSFTIQSVTTQFVLKILIIFAALFSENIFFIIAFNSFGILSLALIYVIIQRKAFFSFKNFCNFKGYGTVFIFAIYSAPLTICINLNSLLTQQIISKSIGMEKVGIYGSVNYFANLLSALQGGFATFWSAYMYANYKTKQHEIKKVNEYLLLAIIFVFGGMILARDVIYLLIGEEYHESKVFFALTLIFPLLSLAAETTSYGIVIFKKTYINLICYAMSVLVNLGLAYFFIDSLGLTGVAIASMISGVLLYVFRTFLGQRLYESISNLKITVIDVTIMLGMAFSATFISGFLSYLCVILLMLLCIILNYDLVMSTLKYGKIKMFNYFKR